VCASAQTVVTGPSGSNQWLLGESGAGRDSVPSASAAYDLLRKPIDRVEWDEAPFEDVIDWLKDMGGDNVNIIPRWGQLANESVDRDSPITLQLVNTTVAEVLNEVLEQLSEDGQLRYHGIGNKLKISARSDFDRKLYRRVYDVTDILFRVPNLGQGAPEIDLQQTTGGGAGGGGGGQSIFSGGGGGGSQEEAGEQAEQNLLETLENLRELIEQTIEPETWTSEEQRDTGGRGRIRIFNRSLVVYNTIEVHEMIAGRFELGD
jgi:hypothetical protein